MAPFQKKLPMSAAMRPGGQGTVDPKSVSDKPVFDLGTSKAAKAPSMPKMPRAPSGSKAPRAPQMPKAPGGKFR